MCKAPFLFWSLGIDYRVERGNSVLEFQEEVYLPLGLAWLVAARQRGSGSIGPVRHQIGEAPNPGLEPRAREWRVVGSRLRTDQAIVSPRSNSAIAASTSNASTLAAFKCDT